MSATPLDLVKEFLAIGHSKQDNIIQMMIDGAEEYLSQLLGVTLASATFVENLPLVAGPLDSRLFFTQAWQTSGELHLIPTYGPVTAVASVVDLYSDNEPYTFTLVNGLIEWTDENGIPYGRWPQGIARFQVTYTAGFTTVPALIKETVCALVKRRYDARSGETSIGASGASQSWGEFNDSDVIKKVKAAYSRRQIAGF